MKFKIDRQIVGDTPQNHVIFRLLDWFNANYPDSKWISDHSMMNPSFKSGDGAWHVDMNIYQNIRTNQRHVLCHIDIEDEELAVMFALVKDQFE